MPMLTLLDESGLPLGAAASRASRGGGLACSTAGDAGAACSVHHILPHPVCLAFEVGSPAPK